MSAAIAVFRLELQERSRIFVVAIAVAVLPFLIALMPPFANQRAYAIAAIGIWGSLIYAFALAFAIGGSTLGRPLVEKRMSFYLAKPVSAGSLWLGKVTAGLAVSFAAAAVIVVPVMIAVPKEARDHLGLFGGTLPIIFLICVPMLFLAGHMAAMFVRSRSIRVVFDFVCLLLVALAMYFILHPLIIGSATEAAGRSITAVVVAMLLLMAGAPVWQIYRGRGAIRDNHAALSNAFWSGVALVVIGVAAFAAWVINAPLSSMEVWGPIEQSSDAKWVAASGMSERAGFQATYLLNTVSGERRRLAGRTKWSEVEISEDGRTLVTVEVLANRRDPGETEIVLEALEAGGISSSIPMNQWPTQFALTPDASRIAVVTPTKVTAYDTKRGALLAVVNLDGRQVRHIAFLTPQVVRLILMDGPDGRGNPLTINELDLTSRKLVRTGVLPDDSALWIGDERIIRFAHRTIDGEEAWHDVAIVDGRTGATLRALPAGKNHRLLSDGEIVYVPAGSDGATIGIVDLSGTVREVTLSAPIKAGRFVAQAGDSTQVLQTKDAMLLVDLKTGNVKAVPGANVFGSQEQIDEGAAIVGIDENKDLAMWDVKTGEKRSL